MIRLYFSIFLCLFSLTIKAQLPITKEANLYRSGDKLCKVKIEYVYPGSRGVDQIWNLGHAADDCPEIFQTILSSHDTIAIFESEKIRHYFLKGDTLIDKGAQSRRSYCAYSTDSPVMKYPFFYGDSISGFYCGAGKDESDAIILSGWGYTVFDGSGCLTDGVDTLHNIIRLHRYESKTISVPFVGESNFEYKQYQWYCSGYRYPIMESYHCSILNDSIFYPIDSISYLYLPVLQDELPADSMNESIRTELLGKEDKNHGTETSLISHINASLSADGYSLYINYMLETKCTLDFYACDILGSIVGHAHIESQDAGLGYEQLQLSRRPMGNILLLNISCGESKVTIKVNL